MKVWLPYKDQIWQVCLAPVLLPKIRLKTEFSILEAPTQLDSRNNMKPLK